MVTIRSQTRRIVQSLEESIPIICTCLIFDNAILKQLLRTFEKVDHGLESKIRRTRDSQEPLLLERHRLGSNHPKGPA